MPTGGQFVARGITGRAKQQWTKRAAKNHMRNLEPARVAKRKARIAAKARTSQAPG